MAANLSPNDVVELKTFCQLGDQLGLNIRHWLVVSISAGTITDQQLCSAFETALQPVYLALLSASAFWRGTTLQKIFPLPKLVQVRTLVNVQGTVIGDPLPPQTAGVASLYAANAGRKFRGRIYTSFPSEADNTSAHVPTVGYANQLDLLATAFANRQIFTIGGNSITVDPLIWHRVTSTYDLITSHICRSGWGTQRRRSYFGRPNSL